MSEPVARASFSELFIWAASRRQIFNIALQALGLASSFVVLGALSVHQFGLYQLILAAVAIAGAFTSGLFDDVVTNEIGQSLAEGRPESAKRLFRQFFIVKIFLALAVAAILFFGADLVARYYDRDIAGYIRLASVLAFIGPLRAAESLFFRSVRSFVAFGVETLQEVIRMAALGAFWFWGSLDLTGVLAAGVIAALCALAYTSFFFIREYRRRFGAISAESGQPLVGIVRGYGRWVFLRYGATRALKGSDVWIVRVFLSTEAVAFYALAINLIAFVQSVIPTNILGILLPWEIQNPERRGRIYRRMVKYGVFFGAAVGAGASIAVPLLIGLLFPKYMPAMPVFLYMLITLPFFAVYKFQKSFLIALREQKVLALRRISEELLSIAVLALFLPLFGLYAAVIAYVVLYGWRVTFFTLYLNRHHPDLRAPLSEIFSFNEDDRLLLSRIIREFLRPGQWAKRILLKS